MKCTIIYFLILFSLAIDIAAQPSLKKVSADSTLTLYGRIPDGSSETVFVVDTIMYLGNGAVLDIYGISDPATPNRLGRLVTSGTIKKIFVQDNRAFIAEMRFGVFIADISDPTNPILLGSYKFHTSSHPDGLAEDIFVAGNYVYVAYGIEGLRVLDVTDPANPTEVGVILNDTQSLTYAYAVDVSGDYAYVANGGYGMNIIDVSDPAAMTQVGTYENSGTYPTVNDICVLDTMAYLSGDWRGLIAVNISDPANPIKTDTYSPGNLAISVFAEGEYVYLTEAAAYLGADSTVGITVIDISDPRHLSCAGEYLTEGYPYSTFVKDSLAFIADGSDLTILVMNSTALNQKNIFPKVNQLALTRLTKQKHIGSTLAYTELLCAETYFFSIIATKSFIAIGVNEVTDADLEEGNIDRIFLNGEYIDMKIVNNPNGDETKFDIGVLTTNGLFIYEVSKEGCEINNISLIRTIPNLDENFTCVDASNDKIAACSDSKLRVEDNSDPGNPNLPSGETAITKPAAALKFDGDMVYVLEQDWNSALLEIFNAADLDNIIKLSSKGISTNSFIEAMDISYPSVVYCGSSYSSEGQEFVGTIDVSNPESPVFNGEQSFEGSGEDIECLGLSDKCVVAEGEYGMSLFDLSNSSDIQKIENHKTGGEAHCVEVGTIAPFPLGSNSSRYNKINTDSSIFIYVADGGDGIYIYKYDKVTGIKEMNNIPIKFELSQNYPNPFNPSTTIQFALPKAGWVSLKIYNLLGQEVATLIDREMNAGFQKTTFDASHLSSGLYLYRIKVGGSEQNFVDVKKMLLLK